MLQKFGFVDDVNAELEPDKIQTKKDREREEKRKERERKRKEFRPTVSYSQPEYLEGLEEEEEAMPYDDFVQDLEVGVVHNNIDTRMGELRETEWFTLHRDAITLIVLTLCVGGIFLVFIGRAETAAFQSQPRLIGVEVLGYICCVPILLWVCFWICPSKKEHSQRKKIKTFQKVRLQPYNESQITEVKDTLEATEAKKFAQRREEFLANDRRVQKMREAKKKGLPTGREVDRFDLH